ncbi:MAG: hypothetical protein CVU73_15885 [Deltaproteobacteria bacterium HGW-Deltaproteobacteria-8]|jgi:hypothetical protein|nr:MAG: hypothetical protein CVU73_15885 [Deltaproteobacteria bacterium HGW-Deltaproteobacteria-8]
MLTVNLTGYRDVKGTLWLLSFWPADAGLLPDGGFDDDAWDDAQTHASVVPGADVHTAFREAYRTARIAARDHGGFEFLILPDYEPIRFPDLEPDALRAPAVIVDDGGPSYRSPVKLSGEELLDLGRLVWREQLGRLRALVSEALESGKNYAEFEAGVKELFPGGLGVA